MLRFVSYKMNLSFYLGIHYKDPFGNLRILDPMKEDEGKYTCSAVNPAGAVDHDIILSVLSKPLFICVFVNIL